MRSFECEGVLAKKQLEQTCYQLNQGSSYYLVYTRFHLGQLILSLEILYAGEIDEVIRQHQLKWSFFHLNYGLRTVQGIKKTTAGTQCLEYSESQLVSLPEDD